MIWAQRFSHWLQSTGGVWKRRRTMGSTETSGPHVSRGWLVLLVALGGSAVVAQWQIGMEPTRPLQLGLMVPEQAVAQVVPASHAPPMSAAAVTTDTEDTASTINTVSSAPVTPVATPPMPSTESDTPATPSQVCVSPPLQPAASDVGTDLTMMPRRRIVASTGTQQRRTTPRRQPHRHMARLTPPRGLSVLAVASRSALLRLPQGSLMTVQAGARLKGWTVQRFSPAGVTLTHDDQRTVLSMTAEPRPRR